MDPHALLLGLTVWLAISSQECSAAAFRGRLHSQNDASSDSLLQAPASGHQDASSGTTDHGKTHEIKVFPNLVDVANPIAIDDLTKARPIIKAAEDPPKSADVAVIPQKLPTIDAKTDAKPDSQSSMPEFTEEGSEEVDENGIIHGKYSYVEEDGVPAQIEYEAVPGIKFEVKTYIKGSKVLPFPGIIESQQSGWMTAGNAGANPVQNRNAKSASTILTEMDPEYEHASVIGRTQGIKVFPNVRNFANPITRNDLTKARPIIKAAEDPPKSADVVVIQKKLPTINSKTDAKTDSQSSMPEFTEEGSEEVDENGIIHGKYSYVEEDGVPAQIEYEAVPGVKFEVKTYIKGSKVLPFPGIIESQESGRMTAGNADANAVQNRNAKTASTIITETDPEYEHASVIGRYNSKTLTRKTRTINEHNEKSESDFAHESEIKAENTPNDNAQVDEIESPVDASYKFGFSADGQTRDEEADAQGNVQGSYSYIGEDGIMTRVEYEAGSGKGFIVKRIVHEDTRRSLEAPQSPGPVILDQTSNKLNSKVEVSPLMSSDQVQSEDHRIQTPHNKEAIIRSKEQNDEEEGTENEEKISTSQNNDGSYSFSYATPDQRREESVDSTGRIKSKYSFIARDDSKTKPDHYEDIHKKGFISQNLDLPLIHTLQATQSIPNPGFTNLGSNFKINRDGSYTYSYVTPEQFQGEVAHIKEHDPLLLKDGKFSQHENEESSKEDLSTSQNIQQPAPNVDSTSPIQNDGSYSYSYETSDQMRQEEGDNDGNVQGQYSYVADDGVRRTVQYKAGPESGFTAEGSHLPSTEYASEEYDASNAEEVESSVPSFSTPIELETPTFHSISNLKNPSIVENASPGSDSADKLNIDSSNENVHYEDSNSYATEKHSLTPTVGFIRQEGSDDSPQVFLDLSGIRRAVATKDNENVLKYRKVIKKRPIEPIPTNTQADGSYSFEYDNEDQVRKESVDTKGNVFSSYQYKTKDGGRTAVVVIRKVKSVKDNANDDTETAGNIHQKQAKRNIPLEYVNEDRSHKNINHLPSGGRNWFNRKRHIQVLPDTNINNYTPAELQDSHANSDIRTPVENYNTFQNGLSIPNTNESSETKYYRRAKSIIKPFRGNVRYQTQIN